MPRLITLALLLSFGCVYDSKPPRQPRPRVDPYQGQGQPPKTIRLRFSPLPAHSSGVPHRPPPGLYPFTPPARRALR